MLGGAGTYRIGRVCTARSFRGAGLAGVLMRAALDEAGNAECLLDAQSHLAGFYAAYGFTAAGEEFVEDGIPHVPMRRPPIG
jgi:ElaA protein